MNKIEFRLYIIDGYPEIRCVIDGLDLCRTEFNGANVYEFFDQSTFLNGSLMIGICCCGCKGCKDYIVDVSMNGDHIEWFDWWRDSIYIFDKSEYEKAIDTDHKKAKEKIELYEYRHVKKIVSKVLRHTTTKDQYVFHWASLKLKKNTITLNYIKRPEAVQKIYEVECNKYYWDTWQIRFILKRFIRVVLQEGEYMVDRALELFFYYYGNNKNNRCLLFNLVKVALNCDTQEERIVALFLSVRFDQKFLEELTEDGFTSDVVNAIACLMKFNGYQQRKREDRNQFVKRIVTDKLAFKVVKIQDQLKDENRENRINRALEIIWDVNSERLEKGKKSYVMRLVRKALHCYTEDEIINALLNTDTTKDFRLIKEVKK